MNAAFFYNKRTSRGRITLETRGRRFVRPLSWCSAVEPGVQVCLAERGGDIRFSRTHRESLSYAIFAVQFRELCGA